MSRAAWGEGTRCGLAAAGLVVVVVVAAAAFPPARPMFLADRYRNLETAVFASLMAIPLRTVIPEELAFRGVLYAAFMREYGGKSAAIGSSILFGLWHITSSWEVTAGNRGLTAQLGTGNAGRLLGVLGAVLATTAAGLVLCWLRQRSGSLLAPIGLHWALNSVGALATAVVWQMTGG